MIKDYFFSTTLTLTFLSFVLIGSFYTDYSPDKDSNLRQINVGDPVVTVGMTNAMKFTPDTVRVKVGDTVEWINNSLLAHSVTGDPSEAAIEGSATLPDGAKTFNSGMMDPEQTFTHTFETSGTHQYFCIPHEGAKMIGWVIVEN